MASNVLSLFQSESSLARYAAMCNAIAECHKVDEIKDIHDKALAMELYSRQAQNKEAEMLACKIRIRAERRCGELLQEMEKSGERASRRDNLKQQEPKSHDETSEAKTLSDLGISKNQSSRWQQLAAVPEETFESALQDPSVKPTTHRIINLNPDRALKRQIESIPKHVMDFWGTLKDMEREGLFKKSANDLLPTMTESMRNDVIRLIPLATAFFNKLTSEIGQNESA